MTQTTQPRSWALINDAGSDLTPKNEESADFQSENFQFENSQSEDNLSILLSVLDSLNKLNETLNSLDYLITRKLIKQNIYQVTGEKENEN